MVLRVVVSIAPRSTKRNEDKYKDVRPIAGQHWNLFLPRFTMSSRNGLSTVISTSDANRMDSLSPELQKELDRLEDIFTVDAATLKKISNRFGEELQEGLSHCEVIS